MTFVPDAGSIEQNKLGIYKLGFTSAIAPDRDIEPSPGLRTWRNEHPVPSIHIRCCAQA